MHTICLVVMSAVLVSYAACMDGASDCISWSARSRTTCDGSCVGASKQSGEQWSSKRPERQSRLAGQFNEHRYVNSRSSKHAWRLLLSACTMFSHRWLGCHDDAGLPTCKSIECTGLGRVAACLPCSESLRCFSATGVATGFCLLVRQHAKHAIYIQSPEVTG